MSGPSNKRMKLTIALASPHGTREEGFGVLALRRAPRARSLCAVFCRHVGPRREW